MSTARSAWAWTAWSAFCSAWARVWAALRADWLRWAALRRRVAAALRLAAFLWVWVWGAIGIAFLSFPTYGIET
jgi:hypothetical protein